MGSQSIILTIKNVHLIASLDRSGFSFCPWELVIPLSARLQSLHYPISLPRAGADSLWLHLPPLPFDSGEGLSSRRLSLTGSASDLASPCTSQPLPGAGSLEGARCSPWVAALVLKEWQCCRESRCLIRGRTGMLRMAEGSSWLLSCSLWIMLTVPKVPDIPARTFTFQIKP